MKCKIRVIHTAGNNQRPDVHAGCLRSSAQLRKCNKWQEKVHVQYNAVTWSVPVFKGVHCCNLYVDLHSYTECYCFYTFATCCNFTCICCFNLHFILQLLHLFDALFILRFQPCISHMHSASHPGIRPGSAAIQTRALLPSDTLTDRILTHVVYTWSGGSTIQFVDDGVFWLSFTVRTVLNFYHGLVEL